MSDEDKKYKTGLPAIAAFERSGVFKALTIGDDMRRAQEATGIGSIQRSIDASGYVAASRMLEQTRTMQLNSGIGASVRAMNEKNVKLIEQFRNSLALQTSPFTEMLERNRASALRIQKAADAHKMSLQTIGIRLGSALNELDFIRIGQTFERLNLDGIIGSEFASFSQRMAEQINALQIAKTPKIDFGLSENIGDLLARSVEAQEALLKTQIEYVESEANAKNAAVVEALFNRRMAYFSILISILSLFFMIAISWEELLEAGGVPKAEPVEFTQMREAFLEMSVQLDELRTVEEERADRENSEALREAEADAEIASVLRQIADSLKVDDQDQADHGP